MQTPISAAKTTWSPKHTIVAVAGIHQLFFLGLAIAVRVFAPHWLNVDSVNANFHIDRSLDLWSGFLTWDSHFYQFIAKNGYQVGHSSLAFYPLWPILIGLTTKIVGGDQLCISLVIAVALGTTAIILFHQCALKILGTIRLANRATVCLLCYPGSLFLAVPYSEPLLLTLFLLFILACLDGKYLLSFLLGICLPLTRSIGVLAALYPLTLWFHRKERQLVLPACGIVLGYFAYLSTMQIVTGDPFAGYAAGENFIFKPSLARVINIWDTIGNLLHIEHLHSFQYSLVDRLAIGVGLVGLFGLRHNLPLLLLSATILWFSAASQFGAAMIRFLLAVVPVFIGLGNLKIWAPIFYGLAITGFALKIYFFIQFICGYWVA